MLFPPAPDRSSTHRRVVITGAGIITALGMGWKQNSEGFRAGRRAFRPITIFDASRQRVQQAAEANLPNPMPKTRLSPRELGRLDRASKLLLVAAQEAWQAAGWNSGSNAHLVLGTTSGGMSMGESYFRQAIEFPSTRYRQPTRVTQYQAQIQALQIQNAFGFAGPITIIANACASGANAIGHAWSLVRNGQTERALAGGYDALSQMVFAGFDSLQALSPTRCRPFDAQRDGLALGEGAAIVALETIDSAKKRDAEILGEISGYGIATDCHHLTQPQPEGDAALTSMQNACKVARVNAEQIGYLNAHGTGTPLNDSAEAAAINRWAGSAAGQVRVSSTKASVGHLLGAAGAVEAVVCVMALQGEWLPPTMTIDRPDPLCSFDLVRAPTARKFEYALSNSFGFGGANASLVLRRWS